MKNLSLINKSTTSKLFLCLLLLIAVIASMFLYDQLSFAVIKSVAIDTIVYVEDNPASGMLAFIGLYFLICAFPTPFLTLFTLVAGYFFGNIWGLVIVSFTSALGGTLLFLVMRYILREWVQQKVANGPEILQQMSTTDSFATALSLRFIPGLPFPVLVLALALSKLSVYKFYLSSQLGMLIPLFIYVNAGQSLAQIHSIQDILSLQLMFSLLLLAAVPLLFNMIYKKLKKAY